MHPLPIAFHCLWKSNSNFRRAPGCSISPCMAVYAASAGGVLRHFGSYSDPIMADIVFKVSYIIEGDAGQKDFDVGKRVISSRVSSGSD